MPSSRSRPIAARHVPFPSPILYVQRRTDIYARGGSAWAGEQLATAVRAARTLSDSVGEARTGLLAVSRVSMHVEHLQQEASVSRACRRVSAVAA